MKPGFFNFIVKNDLIHTQSFHSSYYLPTPLITSRNDSKTSLKEKKHTIRLLANTGFLY